MYLVDTNIFLEVLLSQAKKEECEKLLDQFKKSKKLGIITDFTVHSIIVTMYSYERLEALKVFLSSLTGYKGLRIYPTDLTNEIKATELATQNKLDMDDTIQYAIALDTNVEAIVSFDKHFNNLKIPRKEPHQIT
ncbi:MAG: PIN domain-containing protein [Candidatus Bathyarchaeia archaeon]|jgi:predicted nucleic acid-binding protein